jgi:hypothetical protein
MSDEAFKAAAREQARLDFANGVYKGPEFAELGCAFVSIVSPDRVGIMNNAMMRASPFSANHQDQNLWLKIFMKIMNDGELPDNMLPVSTFKLTTSGELHTMTILDSEGNEIINYLRGVGWIEIFTPEEAARSKAIMQVYQDEWFALYREAKAENNRFVQIPSDLGVGTYDSMA